ncbi:MAG TPA: RNA polymerase sigma-70 factor [Ohtaekwangia sp.]
MPDLSDIRDLLYQASQGDQLAFRRLFHVYSPKVYSFALRLTHSGTLAEEVVQDIFLKLWLFKETLDAIQNFEAYLFTLTRNHTFNQLKRIAIETNAINKLEKELTEAHHETEETILYRESQHILNQVVSNLPPQQKLVYGMCHQEGLKYEEVAQRLNISRLTVKTHMQQALRTIKAHFSGLISLVFAFLY